MLPELGRAMAEVHDTAARLKQQSRFLCRQSDRLRGRSNDLLTVAMFQRRRAKADPRPAHLRLIP
jgi:hypothetical protein